MAGETLRVKGYREFLRATDRSGRESKSFTRSAYREVGDIVRLDWQQQYRSRDARSAAGLRTRVRQRGVSVEQSLRKTTGQHPEWGAWQMRRGLSALAREASAVELAFSRAIDKVADHFDR